jgi:radical SAM protein with 4Fe4S-binding SPASM domain
MARRGPGCAVWEISLKCNLRCIHCGSAAGLARSDELSTEEALHLCDALKDIDCQGVALMGGEPFLRPDWPAIATHVHDRGMALSIITNGFAVDKGILRQLVEIQPELVAVSVDGGQASVHDRIRGAKGSFRRAKAATESFLELGFPTGVITTVHKQNLGELPRIRNWLLGKPVAWQIQMATPFGRLRRDQVLSDEEFYSLALFIASSRQQFSRKELMVAGAHDMGYFSRYLPELQVQPWRGCQAGISSLGIQSNGNILGCLALSDAFVEGNVRKRPLDEVWYSEESFTYSRSVRAQDLGTKCRSCPFWRRCKGGCSSVSYTLTGELHQHPYCLRLVEETRLASEDVRPRIRKGPGA